MLPYKRAAGSGDADVPVSVLKVSWEAEKLRERSIKLKGIVPLVELAAVGMLYVVGVSVFLHLSQTYML